MKQLHFNNIGEAKKALNSGKISQEEYNNWLEELNYDLLQENTDLVESIKENQVLMKEQNEKTLNEIKKLSNDNNNLVSETSRIKNELEKNNRLSKESIVENNKLKEKINHNHLYNQKMILDESKIPKIREILDLVLKIENEDGGLGALKSIETKIKEYFSTILKSIENPTTISEIGIIFDKISFILKKEINNNDKKYQLLEKDLLDKKETITNLKKDLEIILENLDNEIGKIKWRQKEIDINTTKLKKLDEIIKKGPEKIDIWFYNPSKMNLLLKIMYFWLLFWSIIITLLGKSDTFSYLIILFLLYWLFVKYLISKKFGDIKNNYSKIEKINEELKKEINLNDLKDKLNIQKVFDNISPDILKVKGKITEISNEYNKLFDVFEMQFKKPNEIKDKILYYMF